MKYKIKTITKNSSQTIYIEKHDAIVIAGIKKIEDAEKVEIDNNQLDGTEILITNTMSIIVIS